MSILHSNRDEERISLAAASLAAFVCFRFRFQRVEFDRLIDEKKRKKRINRLVFLQFGRKDEKE